MNNVNCIVQNMIMDESVDDLSVIQYVKGNCRDESLTPTTLGMLFEVYADMHPVDGDDASWFSREVSIDELKNIHPMFQSSNGNQWARSDNSYLGKKYIIDRTLQGGRVASVKLNGSNDKSIKRNRSIRNDIVDAIKKRRCVVLDVGTQIEVDHKDGNYDVLANQDKSTQKLSDFQPLSKAANDAKRSHCQKCISTGKRYSATRLGYSQDYILGDENTKTCQGCYWFDPQYFNKIISKEYVKCK